MNDASRELLETFLLSGMLDVPDGFQNDKVFWRRFRVRFRQFNRQLAQDIYRMRIQATSAAAGNLEVDPDRFGELLNAYTQHLTGEKPKEASTGNSVEALIAQWRELYGGSESRS